MISVVIPSFNRKESVFQLLEDLYRQTSVKFEVIVVDDNSKDGTAEAVAKQFPKTTVLSNNENRGPCVARNQGIRRAKGDIIVGIDSDVTIPNAEFLKQVEAVFKSFPHLAGLAFRILLPDGKSDDKERWWHPVSIDQYSKLPFQTNYFSGTAFAFQKNAIENAGLFPEILFQYYEEVEVSLRILDAGGNIKYVPELSVLHHVTRRTNRNEARLFFNPRNQILLAVGCYPPLRAIRFLIPRIGYHFLNAVISGHFRIFAHATFDAIRHLPERLKQRKPLMARTFRHMAAMRSVTPHGPPGPRILQAVKFNRTLPK